MLSVPAERGAGFTAIAEMAAALARAGVAYRMKTPDDFLRPIAAAIKECLGQRGRGKPPCPEALECVGALAVALRQDWQPYMAALLEPMFQTGLSGVWGWGWARVDACLGRLPGPQSSCSFDGIVPRLLSSAAVWVVRHSRLATHTLFTAPRSPTPSPTPPPAEALVASMHKAVGALPDLLPRIQALLLDLLSLALARRPFSPATPAATVAALQGALAAGELQGPALTRLTLHTLGSFSWTPHLLLDFIRDHVSPYLDDNDSGIRRSAAVAACHVLEQHVQYSRRPEGRLPAAEQRAVDKVGGRGGILGCELAGDTAQQQRQQQHVDAALPAHYRHSRPRNQPPPLASARPCTCHRRCSGCWRLPWRTPPSLCVAQSWRRSPAPPP